MQQIILVEHTNNKHSISQEKPKPSIFIREWKYVRVSEEQLLKIKESKKKDVEDILVNIYHQK
jgi:hypothetical protein